MEKRDIKNIFLIVLIAFYIILYKLVIFPNFMKYADFVNASFLSMLFTLSVFLLGFRKDKNTVVFQNVFRQTLFYVLLTGFTIYGMGFFVGFLKNAYSLEFFTLINNVFTPIVIFTLIEIVRYVFIWANKDKRHFIIIFTIVVILLELFLKVRTVDFGDFEAFFRFVSSIFLPTIVKNIFFTYICYHVGYRIPVLYRLLVDVFYVYVIPIIPDLGEYLHSIIAISLPVIIYINIYETVDAKSDKPQMLFPKNPFSIADFVIGFVLIFMISMISGILPFYMIGIGSASMKPTINRGDAVVIQKVNGAKGIKKGDIIAFTRSSNDEKSVVVVHRVSEVTKEDGKRVYITKGDANNTVDVNFVRAKQVQGIVRFRVPFLAYPTIYIKDFIENWR